MFRPIICCFETRSYLNNIMYKYDKNNMIFDLERDFVSVEFNEISHLIKCIKINTYCI